MKKLLRGLVFLVIAIAILSSGVPIALVIIAVLAWLYFRRRRRSRVTESTDEPTPRSRIPAGLRYEVLKRDGGECVVDGRKPPEWPLHIDHIVPLSKGGKTTLDNLQTLCAECNLGKGNRDDRDWRS